MQTGNSHYWIPPSHPLPSKYYTFSYGFEPLIIKYEEFFYLKKRHIRRLFFQGFQSEKLFPGNR